MPLKSPGKFHSNSSKLCPVFKNPFFQNQVKPVGSNPNFSPKSPSEVLSQRWIHKGSSQKGFRGVSNSCRTEQFLAHRRTEARQDRGFTEVAEEHVLGVSHPKQATVPKRGKGGPIKKGVENLVASKGIQTGKNPHHMSMI